MSKKFNLFFKDKVAIVTGASSGIGFALSKTLWEYGAIVIMTDINEETLKNSSLNISKNMERIISFVLDISNEIMFKEVVSQTMDLYGKIDFLFNNAGIGLAGEIKDITLNDWKKLINVNILGIVNGIDLCYPIMINQGSGHIVNTASGAAITPKPGISAYASTKHAVLGLSISMRPEAEQYGVKINAVCPGYIKTNIMNSTEYKNIDSKKLQEKIPINPMTAEKCAQVILKGVKKNKAIIPVTLVTWLDWFLYRFFPETAINFSSIRVKQFNKSKI